MIHTFACLLPRWLARSLTGNGISHQTHGTQDHLTFHPFAMHTHAASLFIYLFSVVVCVRVCMFFFNFPPFDPSKCKRPNADAFAMAHIKFATCTKILYLFAYTCFNMHSMRYRGLSQQWFRCVFFKKFSPEFGRSLFCSALLCCPAMRKRADICRMHEQQGHKKFLF